MLNGTGGAEEGVVLAPSDRDELAALKEPDFYEQAVATLEAFESVAVTKKFADKYEALGHYARQAKDKRAYTVALRIRARAIRHCGRLLRSLGWSLPGRPKKRKVPLTKSTEQAGFDAGLSIHQIRTCTRIAAIPLERFEQLVELPEPPSITKFETYGIRRWYQRRRRMSKYEIERLEEVGYFEGHVVTEAELDELARLLVEEIQRWVKATCDVKGERVGALVVHRHELREAIRNLGCWLLRVSEFRPPPAK